ncbi:hypothetical protein DPMN_123238 [Dreissena polymorpha]|uniref:Uncharacterized protein n=1 Tax=Dreissena polymorpha TaxID=45954 RepID=A0A9D4GU14_DREPO|nr:hypothetical protein DPMN_123238 [Dreissena polymorpha]
MCFYKNIQWKQIVMLAFWYVVVSTVLKIVMSADLYDVVYPETRLKIHLTGYLTVSFDRGKMENFYFLCLQSRSNVKLLSAEEPRFISPEGTTIAKYSNFGLI